MDCPYCKKEMQEGYISAFRSSPEWTSGSLSEPEDLFTSKHLELADPGLFATKRVASWYCEDCKILITPVREYQTTMERMKEKWNGISEKAARERKEKADARREAAELKAGEARRKKDPWED